MPIDAAWCFDCEQMASGDCGKHGRVFVSSIPFPSHEATPSAEERIEKAKRWIEEQTKDCHPVCDEWGCVTLQKIRYILDGKETR